MRREARQAKNGTANNGKSKKSQRNEQKNNKKLKNNDKKWIWGACFAMIIGMTVLIVKIRIDNAKNLKDKFRVSRILREHCKIAFHLLDVEHQWSTLMLEDPLVELIKDGLRPVQDRLTSLKIQTSQYEKMEYISGGPTNFMTTSLKELDYLLNKKLAIFTQEAFQIMNEYGAKTEYSVSTTVGRGGEMDQLILLKEESIVRLLNRYQIYLIPVDKDIQEIVVNKTLDYVDFSLHEVIDDLLRLANLFEVWEELQVPAEEMAIEWGAKNLADLNNYDIDPETDDIFDRLDPILLKVNAQFKRIKMEMDENSKYYQLFEVMKDRVRQNIMDMMTRLRDYDVEKRRPYLELYATIESDIKKLKVRIENLKYNIIKKSPDL